MNIKESLNIYFDSISAEFKFFSNKTFGIVLELIVWTRKAN